MTPWEILSGDMDAGVENHLGDSISVTFAAGGSPVTLLGFLSNDGDRGGIEGINPVRGLWHMQIAKRLLPDGVASIKYIEHRFLPGRMRPAADSIDDSGNDFIFDLQRTR